MSKLERLVKVMIDTIAFENKPINEIGSIVNRLSRKQNARTISMKELSTLLMKGYTVKPAICGSKESEWVSQQVFFVDIDEGLSINEAKKKLDELGLKSSFIYTTFNHSEINHKFRIVFFVDKNIYDKEEALSIQSKLNILLSGDPHCKNLNRIYYGGLEIIEENFNGCLDLNKLSEISTDTIGFKLKNTNKSKKKREISGNVNALKNLDVGYLRESLVIDDKTTVFETDQQFFDYIFQYNLRIFLGIESSSSFNCIFHADENPSASIFMDKKTGNYLYKCHSSKCGAAYNLLGIVEKLGKFRSRPKAYDFIKEIFNLEIMETEWQKEQKKYCLKI